MKRLAVVLSIVVAVIVIWVSSDDGILNLRLTHALPIEGPENLEPSGLVIYNGMLFMVSDDHDTTIFKINLLEDKAVLEPYITFRAPAVNEIDRLDFEGLSCDNEGNFYLVSESAFRILRISADGKDISWITPSLRPYGQEKGLFQVINANLEGIAWVEQNRFVVCAERQPRGIMKLDLEKSHMDIKVYKHNKSKLEMPKDRAPDFSALYYENDVLYALQRGAHTICKITIHENRIEETEFWSYESIENSPELRYSDMTYGHAEGLSMDEDHIFLILDNNLDVRTKYPEDRRPLLLIMERPMN
ncbi:hypothetical protein GWO43_07075 [candidate division KSB1 bacterium]|nr:hypothetical protein [candidate division KSB1 bacterium]NIR72770.1 hypothetical protein [candidate division KSB1 bacterium]NIS23726.1 hypothetical protein [candidate division KSB1 bacterium]NIT70646.1 hypothetical protein [candidate division KSB1 bacterium]NIU24374.1 hypothetical protein [candidate division KSB1 bacterium]